MATRGNYQVRLANAYNQKFQLELEIEVLKKREGDGQPMFPAVREVVLNSLRYNLEIADLEVDIVWAAIELELDSAMGAEQKSRIFSASALGNSCPF